MGIYSMNLKKKKKKKKKSTKRSKVKQQQQGVKEGGLKGKNK